MERVLRKPVLAALAVVLLAVCAVTLCVSHPSITTSQLWRMGVLALGMGVMGAVTVTYKHPVSGTTPPTILQAMNCNTVTALVNLLDADTVITITHNWQISAARLAKLFPIVEQPVANSDSTNTIQPIFLVALTSSSVVTINKPTTVGTQGTYRVTLLRPLSSTE